MQRTLAFFVHSDHRDLACTTSSESAGQLGAHRQVLFSISGCCRPGELLAFMGPSGSGKTTLLSIIGGRAQSMMRREGDLLFNGKPAEKKLKRSIGYVMQDDLLYEALTVYEVVRCQCRSLPSCALAGALVTQQVDARHAAFEQCSCQWHIRSSCSTMLYRSAMP